jgi:hypothetical protein
MIVFDLKCSRAHVFEAWFASGAEYERQRADALIDCPVCGDATIDKAVMAPYVPAKGKSASSAPMPDANAKAMLAALAAAQARTLEQSRWVGRSFASEARAMHDGDIAAGPIHGEASLAEARALVADGVPVAPLPFPVVPPGKRN